MESPNDMSKLTKVSNEDLVRELKELIDRERVLEAELLMYLGEVDARELYLEEACSSMFRYCTEVLHLSEGAAYSRITAARAARRFPVILERIRSGALHLCGVRLLAPHLTLENHAELLAAAEHRSKRAIEELVADHAPRLSVKSTVRKLPRARSSSPAPARTPGPTTEGSREGRASLQLMAPVLEQSNAPLPLEPGRHVEPAHRDPGRQEPLGQDRYRIQFTADLELRATLGEAQALLRHRIPDGDLAEVFRRALKLLVADVKRKRFASGVRHARIQPSKSDARQKANRPIPAAIRRDVYGRDGGRCTFVSDSGRRCAAREFLEFHHLDPWARFREHRADRIVLLCRAHNQHAAVRDYGMGHMRRYRRTRSSRGGGPTTTRSEFIPSDPDENGEPPRKVVQESLELAPGRVRSPSTSQAPDPVFG